MIVYGWYRKRSGPGIETDPPTIYWNRGGLATPAGSLGRIVLATHYGGDDDRKHLRLEMTYAEAERLIDRMRHYMNEYPEPSQEVRDLHGEGQG